MTSAARASAGFTQDHPPYLQPWPTTSQRKAILLHACVFWSPSSATKADIYMSLGSKQAKHSVSLNVLLDRKRATKAWSGHEPDTSTHRCRRMPGPTTRSCGASDAARHAEHRGPHLGLGSLGLPPVNYGGPTASGWSARRYVGLLLVCSRTCRGCSGAALLAEFSLTSRTLDP